MTSRVPKFNKAQTKPRVQRKQFDYNQQPIRNTQTQANPMFANATSDAPSSYKVEYFENESMRQSRENLLRANSKGNLLKSDRNYEEQTQFHVGNENSFMTDRSEQKQLAVIKDQLSTHNQQIHQHRTPNTDVHLRDWQQNMINNRKMTEANGRFQKNLTPKMATRDSRTNLRQSEQFNTNRAD